MSNLKGPGNGAYIRDYIQKNLPPMTWNIVAVKVMKLMVKHKLKATAISATDEFPDELVSAINEILTNEYQTQIS